MKKKLAILITFTILISECFGIAIYRPVNNDEMNEVPCYLRVLDNEDKDVTKELVKASYAWYNQPKLLHMYKTKVYLQGGMIMHLKLPKGVYKLQFYTPADKAFGFEDFRREWKSNTYIYDTECKLNVIFVAPTANENNFYNGGWYIDYKAPQFFYHTYPKQLDLN